MEPLKLQAGSKEKILTKAVKLSNQILVRKKYYITTELQARMVNFKTSFSHIIIQFWSGFIPLNGGGQMYPTLTAISPTPTLHLTRFKASSSTPTLLLSFSTCVFFVFFNHPRFLLPFTSNSNSFLMPIIPPQHMPVPRGRSRGGACAPPLHILLANIVIYFWNNHLLNTRIWIVTSPLERLICKVPPLSKILDLPLHTISLHSPLPYEITYLL